MGSIRKQGKSSWQLRYYLDCKLKQETFHGKHADAKKKLAEIEAKIATGTYVQPTKITVAEFLEKQWLVHIKPTIKQTTYDSYESTVRIHIIPALGKLALSKVTPMHIQQLLTDKQKDGSRADGESGKLSPTTVRYIRKVLRAALNQAVKWQLIAQNAAEAVEIPKEKKKDIKPWNVEQIFKFLESTKHDRLYPVYLTAIFTGMRHGEVLGLRWGDIDLESGTASIVQAVIPIKGKPTVSDVKTENGRRTIALSPYMVKALRQHLAEMRAERRWQNNIEDFPSPNDLVFTRLDGNLYDPNYVSREFKKALKSSGLPKICFHDLRHTHATLLLAIGTNARIISERLGHADVKFTMNTYAHSLPDQQAQAILKLDELFELQGKKESM